MPGPTATAAYRFGVGKGHKAIVPVVAAQTAGSNSPEWQVLLGNMKRDIVDGNAARLELSEDARDTGCISVKIVKSEWSRPPPYIGNCRIERIVATTGSSGPKTSACKMLHASGAATTTVGGTRRPLASGL